MQLLAVVALATALGMAIARTDWGQSVENIYYDYWHVLSGVREAPGHTALVSIDDQTLLALKDEPLAFWAPHFGRTLDTLEKAGAKVIGLDVLYQVSAEAWLRSLDLKETERSRDFDAPLRSALAAGKTILMDPDPGRPGIAFGMQLALRAAGKGPQADEWEIGGKRFAREVLPLMIRYAGPPGTIPTVSMRALLQPGALGDPTLRALKGKVVIVAANNAGTPDRHFTPYSRGAGAGAEPMAGGEIHANIVETILSGRHPAPVPLALEALYVALLLAAATLPLLRSHPIEGAGIAAIALLLVPWPALAAFQFDRLLPAAAPQLGIAFAFLMTLGLRLTGEERERARIRQIFGRYVSDEVVRQSALREPPAGPRRRSAYGHGAVLRHPRLHQHLREALRARGGGDAQRLLHARLRADPRAGRHRGQVHRRCRHGGVRLAGALPRPRPSEGATKDLGCVIAASEAAVNAAGTGVSIGKTEEIKVKGKSELLKVPEILGLQE